MEPQSKRARTDADTSQQLAAATLVQPAEGSGVDCSLIDVLPDALLERIFSEHFGADEAWRTARLVCRKWRRLVQETEWRMLSVTGTRPATFDSLAAFLRSGRLRLRGGGAAEVELHVEYRDFDASSSSPAQVDELLADVEINTLGRAAHEALRTSLQAAGSLGRVGVFYRMAALNRVLPRFEPGHRNAVGRDIVLSEVFGTLSALRPPPSSSSSLPVLHIWQGPGTNDEDDEDGGEPPALRALNFEISARALRRALAPFSRLEELFLPSWMFVDRRDTLAIAASCPALQRLCVRPVNDDALAGLSSLAKLNELNWWTHHHLDLGSGFAEFAVGPAGQNLRTLSDVSFSSLRTSEEAYALSRRGNTQVLRPAAMRALAAMKRLETITFPVGIGLIPDGTGGGLSRETVAALAACEKLSTLTFLFFPGTAAEVPVMHGLADAVERSKSLRSLEINLSLKVAAVATQPLLTPADWGPTQEALRRLLSVAAPILTLSTIFYKPDVAPGSPADNGIETLAETRLRECLRAAGPLGAEVAGPANHGVHVLWYREESAVLAPAAAPK
eukprot:tig00021257_g19758.t1